MTRVISVFLPSWSTDRVRRAADVPLPIETPIVMAGHDGRRRSVIAADAAAQAVGIRVGMPMAKAQVLVPELTIIDADPAADAAALERLALWMLRRYSPFVAVDGVDGIVIDATGSDHLHGGEHAMLGDLVARLEASGAHVRAAIADTWGAAWAASRFLTQPMTIIDQGEMERIISPLPISALRIPVETVAALRVMGFERISDLTSVPRAPLTVRFGSLIGQRIDRIFGRLGEPIEPLRSVEIVETRRSFVEPIGAAETIAKYIGRLVVALCLELEKKGLGVRRLDLICHRVDNTIQSLRVGLAQPVRDVKRLTRLLTDKIETIEPGFGIEILVLSASWAETLRNEQAISSLVDEVEPDVGDLVDMLANRVGHGRIYRAAPVASDVPERMVARVGAMSPSSGTSWPEQWPRPTRLLSPAEVIETVALLPDNPPVAFTWRGIRRRVKRADGPERVFGEWWRADDELRAVRDYFRVEDEAGERYWIYRAGDGEDLATGSHRWFMHGIFG